MRKIIAALQMSLDGFIEGPHGELDWVHGWEDVFDLLPQIDTCILGRKMYPGYEQFWRSILADPARVSPFTGQPPSPSEVEYAHFADARPMWWCRERCRRSTGTTPASCGTSTKSAG